MRRAVALLTLSVLSAATVPLSAGATPVSASTSDGVVSPTASKAWTARPASYGVNVTQDVPVTMSDGNVLRVNVYRPANADGSAAKGRFPVILTQTPYNKTAPQLGFRNDYLVERGYVQVVADVRGTGSSGGSWD